MSVSSGAKGLLSQLFTLRGPVDRRTYLTTGLALLAVKYALDAAIVYAALGSLWSPRGYLLLSWSDSLPAAADSHSWLYLSLAALSLPFAWIGIAMTMRRCRDAGLPHALALLVFVPFAKYLMIAAASRRCRCSVPARRFC